MSTQRNIYTYQSYTIEFLCDSPDCVNIYVVSKLTNSKYETKLSSVDLIENLNIESFLKLVSNCFNSQFCYEPKKNYLLDLVVCKNFVKLIFDVDFDSIYKIRQEISAKEITYSGQQLTTNKINQLEQKISDLEIKDILIAIDGFGKFFYQKPTTHTIDYTEWVKHNFVQPVQILNEFKLVNKIILGPQMEWKNKGSMNVATYGNSDGAGIIVRDNNFTSLPLRSCTGNNSHYISIAEYGSPNCVFDCEYVWIPSVTTLELVNVYELTATKSKFRSLPNINTLLMTNSSGNSNQQIKLFDWLKENKGIKTIIFKNCSNVHDYDSFKSYCDSNGIKIKRS